MIQDGKNVGRAIPYKHSLHQESLEWITIRKRNLNIFELYYTK
jgi:hypothetical protein